MRYTDRLQRIIKNAESLANTIILPCHLLLGALVERTGTCRELVHHFPTLYDSLFDEMKSFEYTHEIQGIHSEPFTGLISPSTKQALEMAKTLMERYHQIFLNEGHLLQAVFELNDPVITTVTNELDNIDLLKIVSSPRDMIVFA